jgi:phage I-like protein
MLTVPETERITGYWTELSGLQFEEANPDSSWIQAFPVGEYKHPLYGKIKMTVERARKMALNVIQKVRGVDLAIDFAHNSGGEAAGWVKSAEARTDGLWLFVEWTRDAADQIRAGKWRYFSPEFVDAWIHPQTGVKHTDVLLGGGLTNRPFLKNILPVNLSEVMGDQSLPLDKGGEVVEEFLKKLRAALKLAEDASDQDVLDAIAKTLQPVEEDAPPALSEEQIAQLVESNPSLAGVLEQNKQLAEQNRRLAARQAATERKLAEQAVSVKLTEWHTGGESGKHGLPVVLDEGIKTFMLSLDETAVEAFTKILDELVKTGFVTLGEKRTRRHDGEEEDGEFKLSDLDKGIKALMDADPELDEADAYTQYFAEHPEEYNAYLASLNEEVS